MTKRKPAKRWRRTGKEVDSNKRSRKDCTIATNVNVETDEQCLSSSRGTEGAQNTALHMEHIQPPGVHAGCTTLEHQASPYQPAHENISTFDSIKDNGKPFSRSALIDPPDGLTTELHVDAEYDPSQSFEESLPDMGDWMYNDGHMFNEGFEDSLSEECAEESNIKDTTDKPLYDNASVTVAECLLIIMAYENCHKVTDKAL
ncbi:uncharacterized protein [Nerophis lumbriciformis]|uniref:uncharacterized protein isoform X2 n=1 Tax=Nerophis lumbriciformis TaxID=546530 RepID=UPI002ADF8609|nr:uncharacterized protein LOC133609741 isoform X2 [Nerophis lumbriciformis]